MYLKPHPNEGIDVLFEWSLVYTVASSGINGNIVIWDVDYNKCVKTCNVVGIHPSACQGISWNRGNTNLLVSCYQDGNIALWVRIGRNQLNLGSSCSSDCKRMVYSQWRLWSNRDCLRSFLWKLLFLYPRKYIYFGKDILISSITK